MTHPEPPPLPDELLRRLTEPARFEDACDYPPDPGTIWEVLAPDGELLLFLIVKRVESDGEGAFAFVRAVPLTEVCDPTAEDCAVVAVMGSLQLYTAHCWLEGPVTDDRLVHCVGRVPRAGMDGVKKATGTSGAVARGQADLRESLYDQFDPVFMAAWGKLYTRLDV